MWDEWLEEVEVLGDEPFIQTIGYTNEKEDVVAASCPNCHHHIVLSSEIKPQKKKAKTTTKTEWTAPMHRLFINAYDLLSSQGDRKPTARDILAEMQRNGAPSDLKRTVVSSHYQKFERKLADRKKNIETPMTLSTKLGDLYFGKALIQK